jgi:hypothetical protein
MYCQALITSIDNAYPQVKNRRPAALFTRKMQPTHAPPAARQTLHLKKLMAISEDHLFSAEPPATAAQPELPDQAAHPPGARPNGTQNTEKPKKKAAS